MFREPLTGAARDVRLNRLHHRAAAASRPLQATVRHKAGCNQRSAFLSQFQALFNPSLRAPRTRRRHPLGISVERRAATSRHADTQTHTFGYSGSKRSRRGSIAARGATGPPAATHHDCAAQGAPPRGLAPRAAPDPRGGRPPGAPSTQPGARAARGCGNQGGGPPGKGRVNADVRPTGRLVHPCPTTGRQVLTNQAVLKSAGFAAARGAPPACGAQAHARARARGCVEARPRARAEAGRARRRARGAGLARGERLESAHGARPAAKQVARAKSDGGSWWPGVSARHVGVGEGGARRASRRGRSEGPRADARAAAAMAGAAAAARPGLRGTARARAA